VLLILTDQFSSLLELYRTAALGNPNALSQDLWGKIPTSYLELRKMIKSSHQKTDLVAFSENLEIFQRVIVDRHRKLGALTTKVKENVDHFDRCLLDVGHQPLIYGGSLFLINKVSLAEWLGRFLELGAFFFIGDHDFIQNELTITRFPQAKSSTGLVITPPSWGVPEGTPIHQVPLPSESWFQETKDKIQDNLRSLMKMAKVRNEYRQLLLERLYSGLDLIYDNALSSKNFSFWVQRIWSHLFNVRNDFMIFLSPSSDHRYRKLILPAFEFLLNEVNREKYVESLNRIHDLLTSQNIPPGLPYRNPTYVPFFLECLKCDSKTRIELQVVKPGTLEGKCTVCGEYYSFSYNPQHPDLSDIGDNITPRSDSRAVVNNLTFPILVHIGGSGETQYYSAVIPAMKRLRIPPPILIRSNRVYYNTPWAQKSAVENEGPILSESVYAIFDDYNQGNISIALEKMRILLKTRYEKETKRLSEKQEELKDKPSNSRLRREVRQIEIMLSHNFGRFAPGKSFQEVSWNWLDLAVLTGTHSICDIFLRQLNEQAHPGHTWYITPGKFT
jgi:hypothetical protein